MNLCRNFIWLIPSSLMSEIIDEMNLNYAQSGLIMMITTTLMGVFLIIGSLFLERLGAVKAMSIGLISLMIDGLCSCFAPNYPIMLAGRLFCGIGYGLTTCAMNALIVALFPISKLGIVNCFSACINSLSISAAYQFIVPIYSVLGSSWRYTCGMWGGICLMASVIFLLWNIFAVSFLPKQTKVAIPIHNIKTAWAYPVVRSMTLVVSSLMLINVILSSYYPDFLYQMKSFSLETSNRITSALSIAGICGTLAMGSFTQKIKRPQMIMFILVCTATASFNGMILLHSFSNLMLLTCCFGASYSALNILGSTTIMKIPGSSPFVASAGVATMTAVGSLLACIVPSVQQWLLDRVGMQLALISFGALSLFAIVGCILFPKQIEKSK